MKRLYKDIGADLTQRWSSGTSHHPNSIELVEHISALDWAFNSGSFDFRTGGDGGNGEQLLYLLGLFFEREDHLTLLGKGGAEIEVYHSALEWALGSGGPFKLRGETDGPFWWRTELREGAGLVWYG